MQNWKSMINTIFAKIIFESKINDLAAKKIENLIKICNRTKSPSFDLYKNIKLSALEQFMICNNCAYLKKIKKCGKCDEITTNNYFTLFNIESQLIKIVDKNLNSLLYYKENISELGYLKESLISKFHDKNEGFTLTINLDGVSVFRNNSKDTWPIYLVLNELPMVEKFKINNVIFAGIWCGNTKINNKIIMDTVFKKIGDLESGILINNVIVNFYVIYGSFDKPEYFDH